MTVIVLDGPDKCFKSTTARLLTQAYALKGVHMPTYKATNFDGLFQRQLSKGDDFFANRLFHATLTEVDMIEQTGLSVIFDRHYPSEYVYSKYYNRATDMEILQRVDTTMTRLGVKIIFMTRLSFEGVQDDLDPKIELEKINYLYGDFCKWTQNSPLHLYVDQISEKDRIQKIMDFVGEIR